MQKETIIRGLFYIVGLAIISFGVPLTIVADLGTGAWDALNVGLSETIGLSVGNWVIIVGLLLIAINALLLRTFPDLYAIITVVLVGEMIDFWLEFVFQGWMATTLWLQIVILFIGIVLLSLGIATYLQAKFAFIPIDGFMMAIHKTTGLSVSISKTIGELTALVFALLFSGPIFVGTILVTFLIGPLIQLFIKPIEKLYGSFTANNLYDLS
ncbi:membrane protein [Lottiidibacillus patelloidae]|uniref:Membrane protein n=1 Tax=Lottiidibacillus patelloidae TaxID=2670334 RepID=A0A263BUN8_9BACI|nr:membrane protein [Lottiidibacillus patelloidae]OZM57037.1 membrane protein [Lottiidibacillus patelloidae]